MRGVVLLKGTPISPSIFSPLARASLISAAVVAVKSVAGVEGSAILKMKVIAGDSDPNQVRANGRR